MPVEFAKIKRSINALRRLNIKPEALAAAPAITPMLKRAAAGGLKQVLTAMRFAPDEVIIAFLQKYDSIPVGDRERLPMEAVALAAGVDINYLLGSIMLALQSHEGTVVKIMMTTSQRDITQARIKNGQLPGGYRDRDALEIANGVLPSPKGPTFIGKAIFGSGRSVMNEQGTGDEEEVANNDEPDLDKLFPPANAMQEKLIPIRQRLLPKG